MGIWVNGEEQEAGGGLSAPVTNADLANMAAATIKGQPVGGSGPPVDLTPAQSRAVLGEMQTATAGSAVTTLTLTPAATLSSGEYEVIAYIKSGNATAFFPIYINGDTTAGNYRRGVGTSGAYHDDASLSNGPDAVAVNGFGVTKLRYFPAIALGIGQTTNQSTANRSVSFAMWHTTATNLTSIQVTATVASAILPGSYISLRRIG